LFEYAGAKSASVENQKVLVKINSIVIAILKYEFSTTWKEFIREVCETAKQSESLCLNNLNLLKMLSEEIFDYSKNQMTSQQVTELKTTMREQFAHV
jgi:exportin-1